MIFSSLFRFRLIFLFIYFIYLCTYMPLYSSYKIYTRKQRELWKNMEDKISIILEILLKRISSLKLYLYLFDRTTRTSESISLHTKTIILSNILNNNLYTQNLSVWHISLRGILTKAFQTRLRLNLTLPRDLRS